MTLKWKKVRGIPIINGSIGEKPGYLFTIEMLGKFFILHDVRKYPAKSYDFLSIKSAKKAASELIKGNRIKNETEELREINKRLVKTLKDAEDFLNSIRDDTKR